MIDQFKEAVAAKPDGIVIMGHPGEDALGPLVDEAESLGIIVTSGNNPLPDIEAKYQTKGFGYAGANLHDGGFLTGKAMIAAGLKAGDEALVYDIWHQQGRSVSSQGMYDALTAAGLKVDKLDVTDEVDKDASLAIPILTAYIQAHPNLKAIGTQHGNITADPAQGAPGGRQEARRYHRRRHRSLARDGRRDQGRLDQRELRPGAVPAGVLPGPADLAHEEVPDPRPAHQYRGRHGHARQRRGDRSADRAGISVKSFFCECLRGIQTLPPVGGWERYPGCGMIE